MCRSCFPDEGTISFTDGQSLLRIFIKPRLCRNLRTIADCGMMVYYEMKRMLLKQVKSVARKDNYRICWN